MKFKIWAKSPYIRIFFLLQVIIISLLFNQHIYNRLMSICQSIPASFIRKQRYQITFRTFEVCPKFKVCTLGPRGDPHMRPRGHSRYWSIKWYGGRGSLYSAASGLFIALVIQIPAVSAMPCATTLRSIFLGWPEASNEAGFSHVGSKKGVKES